MIGQNQPFYQNNFLNLLAFPSSSEMGSYWCIGGIWRHVPLYRSSFWRRFEECIQVEYNLKTWLFVVRFYIRKLTYNCAYMEISKTEIHRYKSLMFTHSFTTLSEFFIVWYILFVLQCIGCETVAICCEAQPARSYTARANIWPFWGFVESFWIFQ